MALQERNDDLVKELNDLLSALSLPIILESPQDLTPSLLIAILESILHDRLPISSSIRDSKSTAAKIEAMKIFLGVLEGDILQMDIGLSEMDPRRLAAGEWDEVIFVGRTLCVLGRQYLTKDNIKQIEFCSSSESPCDTSANYLRHGETETTTTTVPTQELPTPPMNPSPQPPPCIHSIDISGLSLDILSETDENNADPSEINLFGVPSPTYRDPFGQRSIRDGGLTHHISDDIKEVKKSWERSPSCSAHNIILRSSCPASRKTVEPVCHPIRIMSPSQYTLALLKERAQLLNKLAKYEVGEIS